MARKPKHDAVSHPTWSRLIPPYPGFPIRVVDNSRFAGGPVTIAMPGFNARPGILPLVQTPGSIYGAVSAGPFAAIPPREYAFRALPPRVN